MTSSPNPAPGMPGFPSPTGPGGGSRFNSIDPIRILKQYKLLLAIAAFVGMVLGVASYFILIRIAPEYTASSAVVVLDALQNPYEAAGAARATGRDEMELFKQTQAYNIGARQNLGETLKNQKLALQNTAWYKQYDADDEAGRLEDLEERMVRVVSIRDTNLIRVDVTTGNPADAAIICNAIVDNYRAAVQRQNAQGGGQVNSVFTEMRRKKSEDIASLRVRMRETMSDVDASATEGRSVEIDAEYQQLIAERYEVQQGLAIGQRMLQGLLQARQEQNFDFTPSDYAQVDLDPSIKSRDDRILALNEELRVARERFGKNHRTVKELEFRIEAVRVEKQRERERLLRDLWDLKVSQAESQVGAMNSRMQDIEQRVQEVRDQRRELATKLAEYRALQEDLDKAQEDLRQLEVTLSTIQIFQKDPRAVRVRVQSAAQIPDNASFPKLQVMVPGLTVLVFGLVAGLVCLKELLDQRIKGPSCVRLLPDADLLGVIPHAAEDPSAGRSIEMVVSREPASLMAESFRQMRTEVLSRMERRGQKTMMLVGSQAGGGVSAVAINLASSIAINNRKVVLIDANFRRPSLHDSFGVAEQPGVADLLRGDASLDQVVQKTNIANLDVMPIGDSSDRVFEHLEGPVCQQMFSQLETRYDLILVDAPPLSIVGDSRLLASQVDAVLLVVRAMNEKRGLVARMMRQLKQMKAELIGIVINGVRTSAGGYFRDNYRAFYEYQNANGARGPRRQRSPRPAASPDRTADAAQQLADAAEDREP